MLSALLALLSLPRVAHSDPPDKDVVLGRAAEQAGGRRVALIIGVDRYESPDIEPLEYTDDDARGLARTLIESGSFARDDVVLMLPNSSSGLRPTRANIFEQLAAMQARRDVELLVVYFSGHGKADEVAGARSNYIFPLDTKPLALEDTGIRVEDLVARSSKVPAKARLIILDACRSEPGRDRGVESPGFEQTRYQAEGTAILFSAAFGAPSWEMPELRHGAFTAYFLQALTGVGDGEGQQGVKDQVVSLNEAFEYTKEQLAHIPRKPAPQSPWISTQDWNLRDIALVAVPRQEQVEDDPGESCRVRGDDLDEALERGLTACGDPLALREAWAHAKQALLCLEQPLRTAQAVRWFQLDAAYQASVLDRDVAARSWRASADRAQEARLRLEVPVACQPDEGLRREASLITPVPRSPPAAPRGGELWSGGQEATRVPAELPQLYQLRWRYGVVERPVLWRPGVTDPVFWDIAEPPEVNTRRRSTPLFATAGGAGAAAAGLLSAGLWSRGQWLQELAVCKQDTDSDLEEREQCLEDTKPWANIANAYGWSSAVAAAAAIGMGVWGLEVRW